MLQRSPCPAYEREFHNVFNSPEVANITSRFSDVIKILREKCGENNITFDDIIWIYYDLFIEVSKVKTPKLRYINLN